MTYNIRKLKTMIIKKIILFLVWLVTTASIINAQTTRTVGSGGNYTTLRAAFVAINSGTITGAITLQIISSTTETGSNVLNASGTGSANYTSVTIYPTGSGYTISCNLTVPLIDLNGADSITIDGRVNATGSANDMIITNTNTGTSSSTIRFINSAENNTVKYCTIKGAETSTTKGVIFFSTATAGNGNDGITIDNCNITCNATNRPVNAIYSAGTAARENSGITISNNNIYDFLNRATASNGINLAGNTTSWTISDNSFYETTSFAPTAAVTYNVLQINNVAGINFTVSGNYIGGKSALCGSTAWTKTNTQNNIFTAINLNVGTVTPSSVQNNTIQNLAWSNSGSAAWTGINIAAGAVNIGTATGNTIGAATGAGSVLVTGGATGTNVYGINIASTGTIDCRNNTIGSITTANAAANAGNFYGISKTGAGTTTISSNSIGSTGTANSINASSASTANNQYVLGINSTGTGLISISNNTVANIINGCTFFPSSTTFNTVGIGTYSGSNTVTGNSVHDISCSNYLTVGILQQSTAAGTNQTISDNTLYNLSNTHASAIGGVYAIYYDGPASGTNLITRNFIHSLDITSSNIGCSMDGIDLISGIVTCSNNIINLGNGITKTYMIYGIWDEGVSGQSNNIYYNTVYISGNPSGTTANTYAYNKNNNAGTSNIRNNIFVNARSGGTTGKHYAIVLAGLTSLTIDYNDYFVSGTGGVLGSLATVDKSTLAAWKLGTGQDANSLNIDPVFAVPGSTTATDYIPSSILLAGITISTISTDYSLANRAGTPTIGAFEGTLSLNVDVYKSGVLQSTYPRLKDAFDKINSGTHTGALELRVKANTTEIASAILYQSGYTGAGGTSNYSSITIYPTVTGVTLSGSFNASLIDLNGADNVTLDGRVNATGSASDLTIVNTNTGSFASAVRFIISAENNTVKYCNINSSCNSAGVGVINFTSSTTGNGNDNNIIEYCNITNAGGNRPVNVIFSSGTSGRENSGNIIRNNNIFNFFNANTSSYGVNISNSSSDWTVSDNSFYETTTFVPAGAYKYYPLFINTGNNNIISNNYIGGSEPLCAGSAWTTNANSAHYFCGIYINGGLASSVVNNTIKNLNYTSTEDNPWDAVFINDGNVNFTGNTIGATTGTGSVTITTPVPAATTTISGGVVTAINLIYGSSGYANAPPITFSTGGDGSGATATAIISGGVVTGFNLTNGGSGYTSSPSVIFDGQSNGYSTSHGIINNSTGTVTISGNNLGSITTVGSAYYSHGFETIYARGIGGITTISNNLIGSLTTPNSIQTSSTALSALQKQDVYGIYSSGTGTTTISGNTVANITNAYSGINSGSRARGIQTTAGSNTIQNNTVRNISTANGQSGTKSGASLIGISQLAATAGTTQTVTKNTVYGLSNTAATAKVDVYGIHYTGPATGVNTVSGNFIHGISISSSNIASNMEGIELFNGLTTCANNIVNLGVGITLGYSINGIWDESGTTNNNNIYFNSVYIGGSVSAGTTSSTAALKNAANTSIRDYRNNILFNARSGGATGKHFAILLAGIAGLTIDYNDYFVSGTGGVLGRIASLDKATLAAWKLGTSQDANSLSIDPGFAIAGGSAALDYYTSATLSGISGTGIITDYATLTRGDPPKIGALEINNYIWQGSTSTDFATAVNWVGGVVPPAGVDIFFAVNPGNHCVLDQNRAVGDITNAQATDKLLVNGKQLTIAGDLVFTNGAQINATATSSAVIFAGSSAQSIPTGAFVSNTIDTLYNDNVHGLTLNGDLTLPGKLALTNGDFAIGANTLVLNGAIVTTAGTLTGGSSTNISIGGSGAGTTLPAVSLNNLTLNRANGISLGGAVTVGGTLALTNGALILGANSLTISGNPPTRTSGTIDASNAGATLAFTNTTAITLPTAIFTGAINNLTINGAGGITASSDFTVDGILNLQSANASDTKGSLDMWDGATVKTLTMGANATTIGVGDVTGIIKRTTINPTVTYTFGNAFTSVNFPSIGTLPTEMSAKVSIGTAPAWRTGAINRELEVIQTGGSGTKAIFYFHYLDSELNGNDGEKLVFWIGLPTNVEYGRSAYNTTENWVAISNVNVAFYSSSWDGTKKVALDEYSTTSTLTWNGSVSDSWTSIENWTPNAGPASNKNIVIPDAATTPNDPMLPLVTEIKSLTINAGGILNSIDAAQLSINGINGAWSNVGGTFIPNTSNVIFTDPFATISGTTNFYDVTIPDGGGLVPGTDNIMRIANSLQVVGTAVLRAAFSPNTIEYNGADQTIINPNGLTPGYYNLILSGSGMKTMPGTALSIANDFSISGIATTDAWSSLTIGGNLTIEDGATFAPGSYNHAIGGNFINYGTFTASTGDTITMNGALLQLIGGTVTTDFDNLSINNSQGVDLLDSININSVLSLISGNLNVGSTTLGINGTVSKTSGSIEVSPISSLNFGGTSTIIIPSDLFTLPPSVNNLTINRSGGVTLGNQHMKVNGLLDLKSGTFSLGTNTLTIAGSSPVRASGTVNASDVSATLAFTNTTAITLPASIFTGDINNLTINGTGGITASSDFTVNGILNLQSVNPSATKGSLDMWDGSTAKILTMDANASTIGPGDVTGIVKRTAFIANTPYTFGNQFTTISFLAGGTYPSQIQLKISIGTSPSWKTTAINRFYDFLQIGANNCFGALAYHYLDTELNGNNENDLVHWTFGTAGILPGLTEFGRSDYNFEDNWVAMANLPFALFPTSFGMLEATFAKSELASFTWNGSESTSWTTLNNWTPAGSPSILSNVTIPDASTTLFSPTLPASTEIATLIIEAAGILNTVANEQLTINGGNGAWINIGGTFNPSTSNVIFTSATATIAGTTDFFDITIATAAQLTPSTEDILRITGTLTNDGILRGTLLPNTIEFNGSNQVIINPNGAIPGYHNLILSGSGTKTMPGTALAIYGDFSMSGSASATAVTVLSVGGNVTIGSGNTLNLGSLSHTIAGSLTNNGGTLTSLNSSITFNGSEPQTITASGFAINNLSITNTNATVTLGNSTNCSIGGNLTINTGAVFDLAANSLATVTGSVSNSGTVKTQSTSTTPVPAGKTWGGYFEYTGTGAQTIVAGTYNNLTMSGSGGATADANITVNGILHLLAANPSAIKGILDMGSNTVLMGPASTTIGQGDATGIIRRTTIVANITYSFGNRYTTVNFPNVGTLPSEMSLKISIGSAPPWKTDGIKRIFDLIQTGGSNTQMLWHVFYLDTELNGNNEDFLVYWAYTSAISLLMEHGRSAFDNTNNWVAISNVNMNFFSTAFGVNENTLGKSETLALTWNGSVSTSWTTVDNWTPNGSPSDNTAVTIPDAATTIRDPNLPNITACSTINLESGAILNANAGAQLTLLGGAGSWTNSGGIFNAGTSTIVFKNSGATMAGSTDFNNVTIDAAAVLVLQNNTYLGISGVIANNGPLRTVIGGVTTVEYKGGDQTVVVPNPATNRYSTLILSGNGTKTMPGAALNIEGNFTMSGTATATAGAAITIAGNVTIGIGSAFITGNYSHFIGGNFDNNGTFTTTAGNTITMNGTSARSMGGTTTTTFDNLTLNNSLGVTLLTDEIVNNALTLTSGNLSVGSTKLGINGTISKTSGSIEAGTLSSLSFGGTSAITLNSNLFTTSPSINNLTINRTGGVTLGNQDMTVNGLLDLSSGTLSLGANTLTIAGSSPVRTSGTIDAGNSGAALAFTNSAAITLPTSVFTGDVNNLIINGTGGITASNDFTINGVLNLQSDNPSATKGSLDMWDGSAAKILTMGANATTIGTGDVTGIIKRTSFIANTIYTFGNQFTTISFATGGTYPSQIQAKVSIGAAPPWKTTAINRLYDIIQTGADNCFATVAYHYLDTELNGNIEDRLIQLVYGDPGPPVGLYEAGRSNSSNVDNWVSITNVGFFYFATGFGMLQSTLGESVSASYYTWNGSQNSIWANALNWTPNGVPTAISSVIIPDAATTLYSPALPASIEIKTLTIETAAILNADVNEQFTLNGDNGAWSNAGGTFSAANSQVIFTNASATISGSTDFYDVTINSGAVLSMTVGSIMGIAGTMNNIGTWHTVVGGTTIVDYNGGNQVVAVPNPLTNRYNTLILSGSGVKTLPATALTIDEDFSLSGTATATLYAAITVTGNLTIESGNILAISPVGFLTVTGTLANNADNAGLVLQSDATGTASLMHNTDNVPATVQRYISGVPEAWHFLSSPVSDQSISGSWLPSGTYGNGTGYDMYLWNEVNSCWIYQLDITSSVNWSSVHPGSDFAVGRGYLYSVQAANPTKEFIGKLNNGPISFGLTFSSSDASLKGFNLVGNPYPSAIDWSAASGWTRSDLNSSGGGYNMWIWNPAASNYGVYNSADADGSGTNSVTRYIASMQGYFVQAANAGDLGMNNEVRFFNGTGNWFKSTKQQLSKISVGVKSDAGYGSDEIQLKFGHGENENGAIKLFSKVISAPSLYMTSYGASLSVLYLTNTDENPVIPMSFTPGMNGKYTISCNFDPGMFDTLLLEDLQTHNIQNMKAEKTYSFYASKTDQANRFVLHFGPVDNQPVEKFPATIYANGDRLIIDLTLISKETEAFVYDVMGRLLLQRKLHGEINHALAIDIYSQILVVYLKNPDGSLCEKILWNEN
jgi:hypothetical protein